MSSWKPSVALLEASCALGFVACGVVLGFSFEGLILPRLLSHGAPVSAEAGAFRNGAILGTALGVLAAVLAIWRLSRAARQRLATSALALAALTALFTGLVVQHFGAW